VRAIVTDLNARIDAARRGPQVGPPVRTGMLDVDAVVSAWQQARTPEPAPTPAPVAQPQQQRRRSGRLRRRPRRRPPG
jgi:hypothetical protein